MKTLKELVCLATFDTNEVYLGLNWKKKYKSPTDYCFAIKHPRLQQPKSVKFIKFLCAEDQRSLERWVTAMRIAKVNEKLFSARSHRKKIVLLTVKAQLILCYLFIFTAWKTITGESPCIGGRVNSGGLGSSCSRAFLFGTCACSLSIINTIYKF